MADDQNQRPYRPNEPRAAAPRSSSGNDPLAELARLIGQNDPFAEFDRASARRPAEAAPNAPAAEPRAAAPAPEAPPFQVPNYGRQAFGSAPLTANSDLYRTGQDEPAFATTQPGYRDDGYDPAPAEHAAEQQEFYDDAPPSRRRMGVLVMAGIFALAVVGTAGAFGYRAIFGSSSSSVPPPVIKADTTPSKVMASAGKDAQSGKQITDRVNDRPGGTTEKLVSREEQPVEVKDRPAAVFPPPQDSATPSNAPVLGSGVVGSEPKRVRTIAIHPDQQAAAEAAPVSQQPPMPASAPARTATVPPPRVANNPPPAAESDPAPVPPSRPAATRVAPPTRQVAAAPADSNAPLSLSPDAPSRSAPARAAAAPARTAAIAPTEAAPSSNGGGYAVQVSSQRSEADAQSAFRSLQGKYPGQLGGKEPLIHKVDLGAKGVYYRAMVGPFGSGSEASALCTALKAAGGQCIVQKN